MTQEPLYPRLVVIAVAITAGIVMVIGAACAISAAVLVMGVAP